MRTSAINKDMNKDMNKDKQQIAAPILTHLWQTIAARKSANADDSYTAQLMAKGVAATGRKLNEEAVEMLMAALALEKQSTDENKEQFVKEAADLLYHFLVLLAVCDIDLAFVLDELEQRAGCSGLAEKAARKK